MSKRIVSVLTLVVVLVALFSASSSACESCKVPLYAGQDTRVGCVAVDKEADSWHVTFSLDVPGWCLAAAHVDLQLDDDDFPMTRSGNPVPGRFAQSEEYALDPCKTEAVFKFSSGSGPYVAAHAEVKKVVSSPYPAAKVVAWDQGQRKDGTDVLEVRSNPEQGLVFEEGRDPSNFFSLGFGGWIEVEYACPITNRDGPDVKLIEDTWGNYPVEKADVFVSQDGDEWYRLGEADNTTRDIDGIHTIAEFELGDLSWAKYVRVEDTTEPSIHNPTSDGYDLNAIWALQYCVEQEETAWGGGLPFPGRNWATYFECP